MNIPNTMGSHHSRFRGKQAAPPTFNITVVGNEGCGKSTIIRRYITNQFVETIPTKNDEQLTELTPHTVYLSGSQKVGVVFWEVAINPHSLIKREQYSRSDAIIVVVSSVNNATISQWRQEIADMVGEDVPVLVLHNPFKDSPEEDYHGDVPDQKELEPCFHPRDVSIHPHSVHEVRPRTEDDSVHEVRPRTEDDSVHEVHPRTEDDSVHEVRPHTGDDSVHEVRPHTGDDSVHKVINQLLWKLVKNSQTKPYPVSDLAVTQSHTDHMEH